MAGPFAGQSEVVGWTIHAPAAPVKGAADTGGPKSLGDRRQGRRMRT